MKNLSLFILSLIVIICLYLGCQNNYKESLVNDKIQNGVSSTFNNNSNLNVTDHSNLNNSLSLTKTKLDPPGARSSSSLCSTGWNQTLHCKGDGPLDTNSKLLETLKYGAHKCDIPLTSNVSGFCVCKDNTKKYFNCGELGGKGQPTNCDDACKDNRIHHKLIHSLSKPILEKGYWSTPLPPENSEFLKY